MNRDGHAQLTFRKVSYIKCMEKKGPVNLLMLTEKMNKRHCSTLLIIATGHRDV